MIHVRDVTRQKARTFDRIRRVEGFGAVVVEAAFFVTKPLRRLTENGVWTIRSRRQTRGLLRVRVGDFHLWVRTTDIGIARELAVYGVHEPKGTAFLKGLIRPEWTVVDIGSNVGYFALVEAARLGPAGRVIAIEPVSTNVELLRSNVELNNAAAVEIHQLAIGDHDGDVDIRLSSRSNWHTINATAWSDGSVESVPIRTLDTFVAERGLESIDLVRMDVEGYEVSAIEGMAETLRGPRPMFFIELHPHIVGPAPIQRLLQQFEEADYVLTAMIDRSRDEPLRSRFVRVERPTLTELRQDGRITHENKTLTVFLAPAS